MPQNIFHPSNLSAFGTLETAELTPIMQMDFVYGINTQTGISTVLNSASIDTNAGRLRLQSGTNAAGSAIFQSRKPVRYRAGQGVTVRFTPVFSTPAANSTQIIGIGSATNGYFFGFNGLSYGILHRNAGVDTWYPQKDSSGAWLWNGNTNDESIDASVVGYTEQYGTPVMIKYPYLGYGNILFFIQNPGNSRWSLVHTIRYSDTSSALQVSNPSMAFYAQALNAGNTTNLIMYVGSVGAFLSGVRSFTGSPKWSVDSNKAGVTTEINLLTLQAAATYNTIANRGLIRINSLSMSSSAASGVSVFRFKLNPTLGGTPSYTTINGTTADNGVTITGGNSIASYDVAGTTLTGGLYQWGITVDNPGSQFIDMIPYDIFIAPGEIGTLSGFSTISAGLGVTVNWSEDI